MVMVVPGCAVVVECTSVVAGAALVVFGDGVGFTVGLVVGSGLTVGSDGFGGGFTVASEVLFDGTVAWAVVAAVVGGAVGVLGVVLL